MTGTAPSIKFSLTLPRFHEPGSRDPFRKAFDFARHVEQLGYYTGFVGHHHFTPETLDPSQPFMLLAAMAARTEKLRLGTGIFIGGIHHPIAIAEQLATLDQISNGRATFGVGTGYRPYEFKAYGSPFHQRGKRLSETLAFLRSVFETGSTKWDGEFFQFDDLALYPLPVQQPRPPFYVAGPADAAIDRAARYGDTWFTLPMETLDRIVELADKYKAACAKYGTTPRICLMREAWVADSDREVEAEWYGRALSFHRYYWETGTKGDEHDPVLQRVGEGEDVPYQEFVHDRAFAGTPDMVTEEIQRWHDAVGFDECCLIFATAREATTPEILTKGVTQFAERIFERFA
ncbi:MAG: LLM class flavin-dependent oxidoreductase [Ilumatobacteraceae bacterium]